ncbi:MAG: MFS transporter [Lentisphaeria bacterium]|nr:MFS transporter [Lentisphaeria bacterium]
MNYQQQAFSELLPDHVRRSCRRSAVMSTLFGCISEVMLDSNTVIILYLLALGGSGTFSMFATSLSGIATILLSIPSAGIASRFGLRLTYTTACYVAVGAFLLMASAPWFGPEAAPIIVIAGIFLFCLSRPPYVATWYPMCDSFLRSDERASFFGSMRFAYMTLNAALIFLIGCFMGKESPIWLFQIVIALAGICVIGRKLCLDRLPKDPRLRGKKTDILPAFKISLGNFPLIGYSLYVIVLYASTMSAFALAIVYMKKVLDLSAFSIMLITSSGQAGSIAGYALFGWFSARFSQAKLQVATHLLFLVCIGSLAFIFKDSRWCQARMALLFFGNGFAYAFVMCLTSIQMLTLPRPGNKVMAMAVVSTAQNLGTAVSRLSVTLVLALGILAAEWHCGSLVFTQYQTLFLGAAFLTLFGLLFLLLAIRRQP